MIYYSNKARESHKNRIDELIKELGTIPGNIMSYNDVADVIRYLITLQNEIEKEEKAVANNE